MAWRTFWNKSESKIPSTTTQPATDPFGLAPQQAPEVPSNQNKIPITNALTNSQTAEAARFQAQANAVEHSINGPSVNTQVHEVPSHEANIASTQTGQDPMLNSGSTSQLPPDSDVPTRDPAMEDSLKERAVESTEAKNLQAGTAIDQNASGGTNNARPTPQEQEKYSGVTPDNTVTVGTSPDGGVRVYNVDGGAMDPHQTPNGPTTGGPTTDPNNPDNGSDPYVELPPPVGDPNGYT